MSTKLIISLVCISSSLIAQQEQTQFIRKSLIRSDISILGGYLLKEDLSTVHVDGSLEYYIDNKVSIRGSATYMMGCKGLTKDSMGLKDFHTIMLGGAYHIHTNNYFDPYIILQPGLAYTSSYKVWNNIPDVQLKDEQIRHTYYPGVLSPIGTAGVGFNYYFQRFAHLYVETRYVYGRHLSDAPAPISLQELRFTFGLGFNIFALKEKKIPRQ